jgi:hypothetical protein
MMKRALTILTAVVLFNTVCSATDLEEQKPIQRYRFASQGTDPEFNFPTTGLSDREPEHCWTVGQHVTFQVPLSEDVEHIVFENVKAMGPQTVNVFLNGTFQRGYFFNSDAPTQSIILDYISKLVNPAVVEFQIPFACSPKKYDPTSTDERNLGLSLTKVALFKGWNSITAVKAAAEIKPENLQTVTEHWCNRLGRLHVQERFTTRGQDLIKEVDALEQAIDAYSALHKCPRSEFWSDKDNVLARVRNRAVIGYATAQFVEKLTAEWKSEDTQTPAPFLLGSAMTAMFDKSASISEMDKCPQGRLKADYEALRKKGSAKAAELRQSQLEQLSKDGDGMKKQYASEMLDLRKIMNSYGDPNKLSESQYKAWREKSALYAQREAELDILGITFKRKEKIVEELLAQELPIYTHIRKVYLLMW